MVNRKMKILVLTDKYYPRPYANAVCAQELIRVWQEKGHKVDVLAYSSFDGNPSKWDGCRVFYVKPSLKLRLFYYADVNKNTKKGKIAEHLARLVSRIACLTLMPWTPLDSIVFPNRIYKSLNNLYVFEQYDAMIAILKPLTSVIAANRLKKVHPEIPYVVYCVDDLRLGLVRKYFGEKAADPFFWEKRTLELCDAYFYMEARKCDYSESRFDRFKNKLVVTDLPRFRAKNCCNIEKFNFGNGGENWVYAGSIGGIHYDPYGMISIFKRISSINDKITLHMYIRGMEANKISALAKKEGLNIKIHDYVDAGTLERIMASADVIVSLKTSDQISAKIFECMSYGKTIVHFSGCSKDPDVKYLEKYPACKVVKTYSNDLENEILGLLRFLDKRYASAAVDSTSLNVIFKTSTPEYSAEKIIAEIEKVRSK